MALKLSKLHGLLAFAAAISLLIFVFDDVDFIAEVFFGSNTDGCGHRKFFPGQFLKPLIFYPFQLPETSSSSSELPLQTSPNCEKSVANLASTIFRELMDNKLLNSRARALCLGHGSASAVSVLRELGLQSSVARKGFSSKLLFHDKNSSFDFVFYESSLDRPVVPAINLVLEMERVLRPGGLGAMIIRRGSNNAIKFLKDSDVVHVYEIEGFALVAFKKHTPNTVNCDKSITRKKLVEHLEPLVKEKPQQRFSYLSNYMDIAKYKKLVYIYIEAGEFLNSSIANWYVPSYPTQSRVFQIYVVDSNKSVSNSYSESSNITFVHFGEIVGSSLNDAALDFIDWFKGIVSVQDVFTVAKVDVARTGLFLLHQLIESGAMCHVDEVFIDCETQNRRYGGECLQLIETLRRNGAFAHHW